MKRYLTQEEVDLIHAVGPWISGYEKINRKMKPLLKKDAPKEVIERRDRLFELVLLEEDDDEEWQ